jgi:hypothetical protein
VTRSRPTATSRDQALVVPDDVPIAPALVNVVLAACKPSFAAYQATILDLAARGFLTVSSQPDDIWLARHAAGAVPANTAELAHYDRRRGLIQPRRDRLTPYGAQLAARIAGERAALISDAGTRDAASTSANAELSRRALAVAAMVQAAQGHSVPSRRRGSVPQSEAWSAFSGTWRLVTIGPPQRERMSPIPGVVTLAFAVWFAGIAIAFAIKGDTRIWSLPVVLVAVALGSRGMARLSTTLSQPRRMTFTGQVIACWGDVFQDEDPYCVVDDGERAWTFTGVAATYVRLDDLVQVAVRLDPAGRRGAGTEPTA